jgi:hypothetical protein
LQATKPAGCWEWSGALDKDGYGRFGLGVEKKAHRWAWLLFYGDVPAAMHVLHRCDNRQCVRPDHLFLGTHQDNMRDRDAKRRERRLNAAKLATKDVVRIRELIASGTPIVEVSRIVGTTRANVGHIANGKSWSWL